RQGDKAAPPPWRHGMLIAGAVTTIVFLFCLAAYLRTAGHLIAFPYEIDYGEGIVWQQMRLIAAGHGYGRIDQFPAIVFHYPPFYHVTAAALAQLGGMDQLAAGRALSVGCTVIAGAMVTAIVVRLAGLELQRDAGWICGIWAALIAVSFRTVLMWSSVMRVDMLFVALSLAGFYAGMRALTQPRAVYVAAVLFVAAIYTKQTAIAAPAAVFATLLYLRPQVAWRGIATVLAVSLAALGPVLWLSDGQFFQHIIMYNVNRLDLGNGLRSLRVVSGAWAYCGVAAWAIYARLGRFSAARAAAPKASLRQHLMASAGDASFAMVLVYFALATLMLAMVFKSGSSDNYYLEWEFLLGLFAGIALFEVAFAPGTVLQWTPRRWIAGLALGYVAWLSVSMFWNFAQYYNMISSRRADMQALVALIKDAQKPVISDDMVAVLRGGKYVQWEPAIFAELAHKRIWDERPFAEMIKAGKFAFFVTDSCPGDKVLYEPRYNPAVSAAMMSAYPVQRVLGEYHVHFAQGALPAGAEALQTDGSCSNPG
ncbi:MAG: hypothetical protein ABIU18_05690, partial [Novosphingobium sp.]